MNSARSGRHNLTCHILPSSLSRMTQNLSPVPCPRDRRHDCDYYFALGNLASLAVWLT